MEYLIGTAAGLCVILAFSLGFFCAMKLRCEKASVRPTVVAEVCGDADDVEAEKELIRKIEAERKAFTDCMNYDIDTAYGK